MLENIDGAWYYFNNNGYMLTGWQKIGGKWYYLETNGGEVYRMASFINGNWYYLNPAGPWPPGEKYQRPMVLLPGDPAGAMLTGWQYIGSRWYFGFQRRHAHRMATIHQWKLVLSDGSGAMLTGWQQINGRWYYFDGSGGHVDRLALYQRQMVLLLTATAPCSQPATPDGYFVDGSGVAA